MKRLTKQAIIMWTVLTGLGLLVLGVGPALSNAQEAPSEPSGQEEAPNGADEIRLNFRGVPLEQVLEYLSEAAGFVIVKEADLQGRVDVWSHQPLNRNEAVNLLNTVLNQKGYAAIRNGRTLTIVDRDEARTRDIPVKTGNTPTDIPKTDEMVTQIVPVRYANATDLIENLQPLLPEYASLTANQSSNAIVVTDTQTNVRRMVEIIRALDTSISSISSVRVFHLNNADAASVAEMITELFAVDNEGDDDRRRRFGRFGRDGDEEEGGSGESAARQAASRVVAVADERSNSVVVSAPEDYFAYITQIVQQVDITVSDTTEIRVFKLKHADATETSELITSLFPDESNQEQNQTQFPFRFGRGRFNNDNNQNQTSQRQLRQGTVRCEPDPRTNSIVVTASSETMKQIAQMVEALDAQPDKQEQVHVYQLQYADVENVTNILRRLFEDRLTGNTTTDTNQNANTLGNRTVQTDDADDQTANGNN